MPDGCALPAGEPDGTLRLVDVSVPDRPGVLQRLDAPVCGNGSGGNVRGIAAAAGSLWLAAGWY